MPALYAFGIVSVSRKAWARLELHPPASCEALSDVSTPLHCYSIRNRCPPPGATQSISRPKGSSRPEYGEM
jgi:hypothetical protein